MWSLRPGGHSDQQQMRQQQQQQQGIRAVEDGNGKSIFLRVCLGLFKGNGSSLFCFFYCHLIYQTREIHYSFHVKYRS